MWRLIWFCVIDLSEDLLLNKDLKYLVVLRLKSFAARTITEWNSLPDSYHLVGFGIILQKPAVCYVMPLGVHTPLPRYPSGDWQLLSRSRTYAKHVQHRLPTMPAICRTPKCCPPAVGGGQPLGAPLQQSLCLQPF